MGEGGDRTICGRGDNIAVKLLMQDKLPKAMDRASDETSGASKKAILP